MRTTILNLVTPVAVIVMGLAGALSTNAEKNSGELAPVRGYKKIVAQVPCQFVQMCDNLPGYVCKSSIDESPLYRLNTTETDCPNQLFRSTEH